MLLAFTNPKSLVNFLFSKLMSPSTHQIKLPLLPPRVRQCGVFHVTVGCWMSNRWCIIIPYLLYISTEKALKSKVTSSDIPWFFEICKCRRKPQHCQISRWYSISWGNHKSIIFGRMSSCMIWNPQVFLELADFLIFKTYEFHQVLLRNLYNMSLDVPLLNNLFTIFKPCPQKSEWFRPIKTKDLFFLVPLFSFQKPFEALNCSVCVCHVWVTCSVVGETVWPTGWF